MRARMYYTVADDGLSLAWHGVVFVNPPYGRSIGLWVAKAKAEVAAGHARLVLALHKVWFKRLIRICHFNSNPRNEQSSGRYREIGCRRG